MNYGACVGRGLTVRSVEVPLTFLLFIFIGEGRLWAME